MSLRETWLNKRVLGSSTWLAATHLLMLFAGPLQSPVVFPLFHCARSCGKATVPSRSAMSQLGLVVPGVFFPRSGKGSIIAAIHNYLSTRCKRRGSSNAKTAPQRKPDGLICLSPRQQVHSMKHAIALQDPAAISQVDLHTCKRAWTTFCLAGVLTLLPFFAVAAAVTPAAFFSFSSNM